MFLAQAIVNIIYEIYRKSSATYPLSVALTVTETG